MPSLEESLKSMGLTATEARVYLAGLREQSNTLHSLGKATDIKRPTLYYALHTLIEKGLAAEQKESNKSYFTMADPQSIRGLVERQRDELDERMKTLNALIPALTRLQGVKPAETVSAVQYHGLEGMKTVIDIACYCKSKRWDIIAPIHNFLREDPEYAQRYLRARKYHRITARTLWERMPDARKLTPQEIKERNPRYMPKSMRGKFQSMIILFDDKVAMFSSYERHSAILITSEEIHTMFLAMFEALWDVSEAYE